MNATEFAAKYNPMYRRLYEFHLRHVNATTDGEFALAVEYSKAIPDNLERELAQRILCILYARENGEVKKFALFR